MPPKEQNISAEEEIRQLEQKLQEKKRELQEHGDVPHEKEVLREVLRTHIEELKPSMQASTLQEPAGQQPVSLSDGLQNQADELAKKEAREEYIKKLVEIALSKSLQAAVAEARKTSPYLLDELHDHLVDEYYEKLVQSRKLSQL